MKFLSNLAVLKKGEMSEWPIEHAWKACIL